MNTAIHIDFTLLEMKAKMGNEENEKGHFYQQNMDEIK
jgi:hypothetical protein